MAMTHSHDRLEVARLIAELVDESRREGRAEGWRRVLLDPVLRAELDACLRAFELLEPDAGPARFPGRAQRGSRHPAGQRRG
jgi:hypothetical protein